MTTGIKFWKVLEILYGGENTDVLITFWLLYEIYLLQKNLSS